jgi:roadblock/LC7 domain-containing protein
MNGTQAKRIAVAAAVVAATASGAAVATAATSGSDAKPAHSHSRQQSGWTPNDCIRVNGGDFNACNVGNSGRGDLPYRPVNGA